MSMGYVGSIVLPLQQEVIEQAVPKEYAAFIKEIDESRTTLELFAKSVDDDENPFTEEEDMLTDEETEVLTNAYRKLILSFRETVGLGFFIGYHDNESLGSCYDAVKGVFYSLLFSEVYTATDAAESFEKKTSTSINLETFVSYG